MFSEVSDIFSGGVGILSVVLKLRLFSGITSLFFGWGGGVLRFSQGIKIIPSE